MSTTPLRPILGVLEIVCLTLYLVPRTAPIGAILWTGYLGGAIATHLLLDDPLFSHILFPTYVAALLWGGLARGRRGCARSSAPSGRANGDIGSVEPRHTRSHHATSTARMAA